ncbi:MAG: hypothetical protein M1308_07730 [Actinobacteria bacterium]|nr:hypothetical protein [Actinomycetota bacterium]MCL5070770.1 hypothetical protein [Actinomycetota bacterium]
MIKVVYIYNLKEGVNVKEFEDYYFNIRIPQVMKIPNLEKFGFNITAGEEKSPFRYMAECYYKDLKTAKETLESVYFKDVHGYISGKLADMNVMFYETHEWIPSEWKE